MARQRAVHAAGSCVWLRAHCLQAQQRRVPGAPRVAVSEPAGRFFWHAAQTVVAAGAKCSSGRPVCADTAVPGASFLAQSPHRRAGSPSPRRNVAGFPSQLAHISAAGFFGAGDSLSLRARRILPDRLPATPP